MTCENQSLLVVPTFSSLRLQFIQLLYCVIKIGKEKSMHSSASWISLKASCPDTNLF